MMALMKKVVLPVCVLLLIFIICVYIPSSTTNVITLTSPKALPRRAFPSEANSSYYGSTLVQSLDPQHSSNRFSTAQPKQPVRVFSSSDQISAEAAAEASKQKYTSNNIKIVTASMETLKHSRESKVERNQIMDTVKAVLQTSVTPGLDRNIETTTIGTTLVPVQQNSLLEKDAGSTSNKFEDQREYMQSTNKATQPADDTNMEMDSPNDINEESNKTVANGISVDAESKDTLAENLNVNSLVNDQSMADTLLTDQATKDILSTKTETFKPNCKVAITKIVFIKTHKTGSTTMASIFERFGYRRNLLFALPRAKHIFVHDRLFSSREPIPIPTFLRRSHPHYDILTNHAVYNRPEMNKIVPDATYITILRDPVTQLESAFGYFEMAKGMGISKHPNPLEVFMQKPNYYYNNTKYNMKTRSRNGQLFDLGFIKPNRFDDTGDIVNKIEALDKEFDLVLITEYFDESLIVMKKLLCWTFDDILYISNGIRSKSHRFSISENLKTRIRKWNAGDVLLYNHFNRTLWQKIKDYGPTFQSDLDEFRRLEKGAVERCVDTSKVDKHDRREVMYVISPKHSGTYCQDLLRADVPYTRLLKQKMKEVGERALDRVARHRQYQEEKKQLMRRIKPQLMKSQMMRGR